MDIRSFEKQLDESLLTKGNAYYRRGKVRKLIYTPKGNVSAVVHGSYNYSVEMHIDNRTGTISWANCSCPAFIQGVCKHCVAVLYACRSKFAEMDRKNKSSLAVERLIKNGQAYEGAPKTGVIDIEPHIVMTDYELACSLTIGMTRMYKVRDVRSLYQHFLSEDHLSYGKELDLDVDMSMLTDRAKRLLSSSYANYQRQPYFNSDPRSFPFEGMFADEILSMYKGEQLDINGVMTDVTDEEPTVRFRISTAEEGFKLLLVTDCSSAKTADGGFVLMPDEGRICKVSRRYVNAVFPLLYASLSEDIYITRQDMPAFWSAVLRNVRKYAVIEGVELIEDLIPPDMVPQLYIDAGSGGDIVGLPVFVYGDEMINYSPKDEPEPPRDIAAEKRILSLIRRYMRDNTDPAHPFICDDDEQVYRFLTEGSTELMNEMEVYGSERFRRLTVRPPVKPVVGVRPDGELLALDISDDNYTQAELLEVLQAYRKGAKYHRLRDGSFALIGEEVSGFEELTANLNITDRQFLKDNIRLPKYRMMYLDSLKNMKSVRLRRSAEFKDMVGEYRRQLDNADLSQAPAGITGTMRDYQLYGYHWLKTIASYGFGGILADDMGLGKTIQALALMTDAKKEGKGPFLVVCPSSLTLNWLSETEKFAPSLKTVVIAGTAQARADMIADIGSYDLAVTSYASLTRDIDKYEGISFSIEFIDEAQYIKNHVTQAAKAVKGISAPIRFALTGTPVENSLAELWSIFDFIMPDYLFSYSRFKKTYETPIVTQGDRRSTEALQRTVSPFILRRMKKDVLTELPEKTEIVLVSAMEPEQRKLYTAQVMQVKQMLHSSGGEDDRIKILAQLMRLRQICCDPSLIYEDYTDGSAKLTQCMDLIESCINSGHKLLLFSQFTSMLAIIGRRLTDMGIPFYQLTGSTKPADRLRMVNAFNSDDTKVFLISLKAGGTGLNLTGADIVIHYDPWWNLSAEEQASDRVYRIGQKNSVTVYKLIADRSIEQNILGLQEKKAALSDIAVGGDRDIMHMSADEIISIIE